MNVYNQSMDQSNQFNKQNNKTYLQHKKERREKKKIAKRDVSCEDVIFIFEKVLEGWSTIRIYNTIRQRMKLFTILETLRWSLSLK